MSVGVTASIYDPIRTLAAQGINIVWSDFYPDPVTIFAEDGVAFAHPTLDTAGLRAGIAQALSRADTTSADEAIRYAAHLLISGTDLAHACAHNRDSYAAARSLGVTLDIFNERISTLSRRGRTALRLAVARDYCPRCRIKQLPLGLEI